ncbi:MAG: hypothetical protein IT385_26965 [Deltaproteobacteria bacterium]|nr:hypothetical protein [Deltaproteobacteria bacterium]
MADTGMESWRRNGTCGACALFTVDFGEPPTMYGHCKMYSRSGQRTSTDATCHEFKPLEGFAEKVVLNVRTHVPDSTRRSPGRVVQSEPEPVTIVRRRGDEEAVVSTERPSEDTVLAIATALEDPAGALDPAALDESMLDVVESFGVVHDERLDAHWKGSMFVLRPADAELKPGEIDVETFFHKIVMIRDRLRTLEQKVNAHQVLSDLAKIELQAPITRLYGALTAFNTLFKKSASEWRQRRPTRRPLEELLRRWAPRDQTELAPKWVGGVVTVQPGPGSTTSGHDLPMDLFFDRVLRLKRRMRQLEQTIEQHPVLDREDKATLLDYLSKSYGSLTTLNVLFRHADDKFSSK